MKPKTVSNPHVTLTAQQTAVVRYIETFRETHPFGPNLEEIATAIGRGKTSAAYHVRYLLAVGVLCAATTKQTNRIREGSLHVAPEYAKRLGEKG